MGDLFRTTQWSIVLKAARGGPDSHEALERLCGSYWPPLYAFVRRRGHDAEAARDLTQSFFTGLLEQRALRRIDPRMGRFRAFLLASMKNFLVNEFDREQAQKRRADNPRFLVNLEQAERGYPAATSLDPEDLYESRWARTVLDRALGRLREENEGSGRAELFRRVRDHLTGDDPDYERLADLGMSPGALRVAVHRMRRRLGALLRDEVAQTVSDPAEVDAELRCLLQAAARGL